MIQANGGINLRKKGTMMSININWSCQQHQTA